MHVTAHLASDERRQHRLGLFGLVVGLSIGGMTLLAVAGPPHLPAELPNRAVLTTTLNGSYLPPEAVAYVVATLAWVLWGWLTLSLALRLVVLGAEIVTRGAAWVRALRLISDRVTLPVVRGLVDGAVVTVLVVNLVARAAPASAAPISSATIVAAASNGGTQEPSPSRPAQGSEDRTVRYTVQQGDTLWSIAERFYGTGFEYERLVRANAGTSMPDGSRFTRTGVIQPGWTIAVPLPSQAIDEVDGQVYYVVEDEDTLRGVAARLLGDEAAWPQIFDANRDSARLPNGRALTRPDLIWPGLRLLVPIASPVGGLPAPAPAPAVAPEVSPSPQPVSPVTVQPSPEPAVPTPEPTVQPEVAAPPLSSQLPGLTPEPTVTPAPPEPTFVVTPISPDEPTAEVEIEPTASLSEEAPSTLIYGGFGLAALAAAASATLLALHRLRRRLSESFTSEMPEEGPATNEGFAEAELARVLEHRLHGGEVEPAVIVADQALRFFDEHGVGPIDVVTVGQRRTAVALTLSTGFAVQRNLIELAPDLGARLGGTGESWRTADHDILVLVSGLKLAGPTSPVTDRPVDSPILLPIGVLPGRETLYANWRELGHVLVAGLPGGGVEVVLTSLIGALTARCRPDEVRLVSIASRRALPSAVFSLPHQSRDPIDPMDEDAVTEILQELREELDRRMGQVSCEGAARESDLQDQPEIVVVVGDLDGIESDATTLELIGVHGPAHGIRLLVASTHPEGLGDELLVHFTTRLALQTLDEDSSIRLIGRPDAADLGGGGDLFVRIDGRTPIRARGFRLAPEHLDQLVKVMREAYVGRTTPVAEAECMSGPDISTQGAGAQPAAPIIPSAGTVGLDTQIAVADHESAGRDPSISQELSVNGVSREGASRISGSHANSVSSAPPGTRKVGTVVASELAKSPLPIQARCFGTFRVTLGDRDLSAVGSDGGRYTAWEILAFLCVQPGGVVSRERLIGAFWPDVDSRKAAGRLKVSLARLRTLLAEQVPGLSGEFVRVERSGVCRLNTDYIVSDVQQFVTLHRSAPKLPPAAAAAAYEQARALYRGDLLTEADYEWIHARADDGITLREQYRAEYFRVTQRLAELYREHGQPARAVTLYREILKAEPTLEDVTCGLYRCFQELGDRRALVREHRRLRDAIRQMLSSADDPDDEPDLYEPETETIALYDEILADLDARSAVARPA